MINRKFDLDFRLAINCNMNYEDFQKELKAAWNDLNISWSQHNAGQTSENLITTEKNVSYNLNLIKSHDGWLYYPYNIDVTFLNGLGLMEDLSRQKNFVELLATKLQERKEWQVKVIEPSIKPLED